MQIANYLRVSPGFFVDGLGDSADKPDPVTTFLGSDDAVLLAKACVKSDEAKAVLTKIARTYAGGALKAVA